TSGRTPTGGEATVKGEFTQGNIADGFCAVTFTPADANNYNTATCMIPTASTHAKSKFAFTELRSMLRAASIPATNGSFGVYNGSSLITDSKAWQGVTITLNPIPQDGYYFIGWDKVDITVTNGSVVNREGQIKIDAAATTKATEATTTIALTPKSPATTLFAAKETPTPSISSQSVAYDGKAHFVTSVNGWNVTYKQKTVEVTTPQNAGVYDIWLQREQTESEKAYSLAKSEATLTISKAMVNLTAPTASEVQAGDKLMSSILSGGAATYGSNNKAVGGKFAWDKPESTANSGTSVVKFLLDNTTNFSEPTSLNVIVPVATATKFAVTYTAPQNGTLTVKTTDGKDVSTGSTFIKGTELMIQATPANGYKVASYNAGGAQPTTGKETEPFKITIGDAAVSIVVTFEKITTPATLVQSIELAPKKKTLNIGETLTFTTIILPTNASNKALTWKSSDDKVATVNAGQVKAIAVGTAVITATAADGSKAYDMCVLTVKDATPPTPPTPAIGISLNIHAKALAIGGTFTLTATVAPSTASQQVKWTTSDKTVATVDENGKVKAIAAGTANVTATTKDGEFSDKCEVTVIATTPVAVTGIKLDMTTLRLGINKIDTLTATITPATATNKKIIWTSSNPKIVSITATTLNNKIKLKGLKHGSAAIIAMTEDGHFLATCDVTVYDPTGIEELLANTRVYPLNGAICIDPAQPVEVTVVSLSGAQIYREKLTTAYQIPVATGVYLVVLSDGKHQGTVKVFVK
ncbi:MAG: Ig-like domain-containing protein, partial [Tannerellaceae bacterium]